MGFSFPKSERLYKKKDIQELFDKGSSFYIYPFRLVVLKKPENNTNQVLFSVSKKNFKKAVDRNRIKRRMREAYRLNKALFADQSAWQIAYIYTAKEILESGQIHEKMRTSFKRIEAHDQA